jgi:hypothetical protein
MLRLNNNVGYLKKQLAIAGNVTLIASVLAILLFLVFAVEEFLRLARGDKVFWNYLGHVWIITFFIGVGQLMRIQAKCCEEKQEPENANLKRTHFTAFSCAWLIFLSGLIGLLVAGHNIANEFGMTSKLESFGVDVLFELGRIILPSLGITVVGFFYLFATYKGGLLKRRRKRGVIH